MAYNGGLCVAEMLNNYVFTRITEAIVNQLIVTEGISLKGAQHKIYLKDNSAKRNNQIGTQSKWEFDRILNQSQNV